MRRVFIYTLAIVGALIVSAVIALAQTGNVRNPTSFEFTPSIDHALVDSYELDILRADGSVLQTINAGKPQPNASNICVVALNVQPVGFGINYSARLRAVAGGAFSDYTVSVNKFDRVPGAPSGGRFK